MIGMRTILEVADNSGARKLQCILPRGGDLGLRAGLGDVITASVKEAAPDSNIKKGKVVRCVVVRMRKETRRKVNKAFTRADAKIVRCPPDPAEIAKTLPIALSLMEQAPGEKGEAVRNHLRPLLERAAPALITQGRLWLDTLYLNNQPAACTLQFPHPTGPQLYNCGFDAAKREFSPGVVLTAEILRHAIESGAQSFDLLRGQEPYKYKLGAQDRPLWMLTLRKV